MSNEALDPIARAQDATDRLRDYLNGYLRSHYKRGQGFAPHEPADWSRRAREELERRRLVLVQMFDDDLLELIAEGSVNVAAAMAEVIARNEAEGRK